MHAAPSSKSATRLSGTLLQFLLSPKGSPEGLLLQLSSPRSPVVQVNFEPELVGRITQQLAEGDAIEAHVIAFPDAHHDAHPVYALIELNVAGKPGLIADGSAVSAVSVRGKVTRLNYARRGEVNGAILDTGDFVHLRPHGVKAVGGLSVGQMLEATGDVRPGWAGVRVLEAQTANGVEIGKPPKPKHGPKH